MASTQLETVHEENDMGVYTIIYYTIAPYCILYDGLSHGRTDQ